MSQLWSDRLQVPVKKGEPKMSFCDTCINNGVGVPMSEAEARIHKDNNPDHTLVKTDVPEENKE